MSMVVRYASAVTLLVAGFLLGVVGITLKTDNSLSSVMQRLVGTPPADARLAHACVPDTQNNAAEDEIFFLSCGGIF